MMFSFFSTHFLFVSFAWIYVVRESRDWKLKVFKCKSVYHWNIQTSIPSASHIFLVHDYAFLLGSFSFHSIHLLARCPTKTSPSSWYWISKHKKIFSLVTVGDHFTSYTISLSPEVPKMFMITAFWFSRHKSRFSHSSPAFDSLIALVVKCFPHEMFTQK